MHERDTSRGAPPWRWFLSLCAFLCVLGVCACFEQSRDWNSASRFLLTRAIVEHGSLEITRYVADERGLLENPPTRDLARSIDGRFYCDKAPGQSFFGVIPYSVYRAFTGNEPTPDAATGIDPSDYWVTLFTSGLSLAGCSAVIVLLAARWGAGPVASTATALAACLATCSLAYGTMFYGHVTTALLLLLSLISLDLESSLGRCAFAGLTCGLAIATEYTSVLFAVVAIIVLLAKSLTQARSGFVNVRPVAGFFLGLSPALLGLTWYHIQVTGSPLQPPYSMEVEEAFAYHREGVPIGRPTSEAIYGLTLSLSRGLLWNAGILLGSIPGLWILVRRGRPATAWIIGLSFAALFLAIAGFPSWHGGLATGPRLLVPMIPIAVAPCALSLSRVGGRGMAIAKGAWGIAAVGTGIWTLALMMAGGRFRHDLPRLWEHHVMPALIDGGGGQWIFAYSSDRSENLFPVLATYLVCGILAAIPLLTAVLQTRKEVRNSPPVRP